MKKILLIEDNPEMRENIVEILEIASYKVFTAENGKAGIEKAREVQPDLIISDILMPELDGYGVLYAMSKIPTLAGIPFIFLTAKAEKQDVRKGMNLGADDYLIKPFDDMELLQTIEARLNKSDFIRREYSKNADGINAFANEVKAFPELKELKSNYKEKRYEKRQNIYQEGSYPRYIYMIESGLVKTMRSNEDGKEIISGIYRQGDFFGYLSIIDDTPYQDSAEALEETGLILIPKDDFLKLLNNNRLVAARFIKLLTNNLDSMEERLLKLAYDSVRRRVAEALLKMAASQKVESQPQPTFIMSREDLGNMAGTATESAIRALKEFKDEGLLELNASKITILNPVKLAKMKY